MSSQLQSAHARHLHSSLAPIESTHAILAPATTTTTTGSGPVAPRAFELGLSIAQLDTLDCTLQERGILVTTVVFLLEILLSNLVAVLATSHQVHFTVCTDIKSRLQQPASEASRRLTKSNQASRTNNLPAYLKTKLKENTGDSELATHPCR
ncbi:hypothetical protein COCOBI_19-1010 [Coccomyxa sp. Obi]|nr:hypothetical protein COCOBI_19-0910 [Coccomyxa sp. Obi]BDA51545.1 hypothetical protein COCOBI_19-1010 [Coccomyxa sp. Obi]